MRSSSRRPRLHRLLVPLLAVGALAVGGDIGGQVTPQAPDAVVTPPPVSPGGAFLRAMLVPGWGHAALGSYNRAGFYLAVETLTGYGVVRTWMLLSEARSRLRFREQVAREDLAAQGIVDPTAVEEALEDNPTLRNLRGLVQAREGQREDLLAFGIFLVFLSGIDAYVSGHLADFPAPLEIGGGEGPAGGLDVSLRLPVPR